MKKLVSFAKIQSGSWEFLYDLGKSLEKTNKEILMDDLEKLSDVLFDIEVARKELLDALIELDKTDHEIRQVMLNMGKEYNKDK